VIWFTRIREYNELDFEGVYQVYKEAFEDKPWNETWTIPAVVRDIDSALANRDPVTIVAERCETYYSENYSEGCGRGILRKMETKTIIGLLWGYRKPAEKFGFLGDLVDKDSFYLDDVAVLEDSRKEGIATKLCKKFEKQVKEAGGKKIFLRTQKNYKASTKLYEKLGYERSGIFDPEFPDREYFVKSLEG
jgi:ribosomal protein S18 acetylase RimI-like enzyme